MYQGIKSRVAETTLLLGKAELFSLVRSAVHTRQQLLQSVFLLRDLPLVGQNSNAEKLFLFSISETGSVARIQETRVYMLPFKS